MLRRPVLAYLVCGVSTIVLLAAVLGLRSYTIRTNRQRAIAVLVKAEAIVVRLDVPGGRKCYSINLDGGENCHDNNRLLDSVAEIGDVTCLALVPTPLDKESVKSLLKLRGLTILDITGTHLSDQILQQLREHNPNLEIRDGQGVANGISARRTTHE